MSHLRSRAVAGTMRAVVLDRPGPATSLQVRVAPVPETAPGRELLRAAGKLVVLTGDGATG